MTDWNSRHLPPDALSQCAGTCKQLHEVIRGESFLWEPLVEPFLRCRYNCSQPCPPEKFFTHYSTIWNYYGFLLNPWGAALPENVQAVIWVEAAGQNLRGSVIIWHWNEQRSLLEAFSLNPATEERGLVRIHPMNLQFVSPLHAPTPIVQLTEAGQKKFLPARLRSDTATISITQGVDAKEIHRQPDGHLYRPHAISIHHKVYYPRYLLEEQARSHPAEGLWTGCYSTHGVELLQLELTTDDVLRQSTTDNRVHSENMAEAVYSNMPQVQWVHHMESPFPPGTRLVGHKCTGDFNIPADTASFVIQMDQLLPPTPLLREQTRSYPLPLLTSLPVVRSESDVHPLGELMVTAIYPGMGRVAWTGMIEAHWTWVQMILFDNHPDLLAICWVQMDYHLLFLSRADLRIDNGVVELQHV